MTTLFKFGVKIVLRITWVVRTLLSLSQAHPTLSRFRVRVKLLEPSTLIMNVQSVHQDTITFFCSEIETYRIIEL